MLTAEPPATGKNSIDSNDVSSAIIDTDFYHSRGNLLLEPNLFLKWKN